MAEKKLRILKQQWPAFVKDFNRQNQSRRAVLAVGDREIVGGEGLPLVGLSYEPEERKIEVFFGSNDPDEIYHIAHTVKVPRALYLIRDDESPNPVIGIQIQGAPGAGMAVIRFLDENPEEGMTMWIASVAHTIYERRGCQPGADQQDWFEAEKAIRQAITDFLED